MGLSCSCGDPYDGEWYYIPPNDYTTLQTKRRQRCCSCKSLINIGAICAKFERYRSVRYDSIEEKILGEDGEVQLSDKYQCETCADIYFSLDELGYCTSLDDNMHELVAEYADRKQWESEHKKKVAA